MTDDAWRHDRRGVGVIADLVEPCSSRGKMGRPVKNDRRAVLDAIFHVAATSCQWRALPEKHPHWSTCHRYHHSWSRDGTWERVCDLLRSLVREKQERGADPSAGVIDARSVREASNVGAATRDHDAGKKVNGRKAFGDVDTPGLLVAFVILAASRSDNLGGAAAMERGRSLPALPPSSATAASRTPSPRRAIRATQPAPPTASGANGAVRRAGRTCTTASQPVSGRTTRIRSAPESAGSWATPRVTRSSWTAPRTSPSYCLRISLRR